jgi:hypothetical protein
MLQRSPPLSLISVMVVIGAGLITLCATGVLGVLRFAAIP